jgi:GDP-L-fucose synthase
MRILITGAHGMLGGAVTRIALGLELKIYTPSRNELDLSNQNSTNKFVSELLPDVVIHCAATVGGIKSNINHPVKYILDNILIDAHLINACINSGIPNFIYMSSSCVYPTENRQPMKEEDLLRGKPEPTNQSYAIAKISGMQLIESVAIEKELNYRSLLLSNLYGPGDNYDPDNSHLIAACIRKLHVGKIRGSSEISIMGTGTARREFTYVDDVAHWIIDNISRIEKLPLRMNLGSGKDYSVNEYYEIASKVVGFTGKFHNDLLAPEGMRRKLMDSTIAREEFGWKPRTQPHEGIRLSYEYWLKNGGANAV